MTTFHIEVSEIEGKTTNVPVNMDLCNSSIKDDKFNSPKQQTNEQIMNV